MKRGREGMLSESNEGVYTQVDSHGRRCADVLALRGFVAGAPGAACGEEGAGDLQKRSTPCFNITASPGKSAILCSITFLCVGGLFTRETIRFMTNSRKSQSEKLATGGGRETAAKKPHNKRSQAHTTNGTC